MEQVRRLASPPSQPWRGLPSSSEISPNDHPALRQDLSLPPIETSAPPPMMRCHPTTAVTLDEDLLVGRARHKAARAGQLPWRLVGQRTEPSTAWRWTRTSVLSGLGLTREEL
jgi:hypothetical protein